MKIKLVTVGGVKEKFYRNKIEELVTIIKKHHDIKCIELKDESIPKNASAGVMNGVVVREGERILNYIDNTDYVVALCIDGKSTDEDMLKKLVTRAVDVKSGYVTFVIGGSLGLSDAVVKRADYELSFSRMTFPHQLMRVMLLEQLALYL